MNIYIKKSILFLSIGLFFSTPVLAGTKCFLAKENNQVIMSEGDCRSRHAPCSTFKIAISLMGYHEGLLNDEMHPKLPFKEGYVDDIDKWKHGDYEDVDGRFTSSYYIFETGDTLGVQCYDWDNTIKKLQDIQDDLRVIISSKEFEYWLNNIDDNLVD